MDKRAKEILSILEQNRNLKARDIAKMLGMERKDVNHYLYSELRGLCQQNEAYEWNIIEQRKPKVEPEQISFFDSLPDTPASRVVPESDIFEIEPEEDADLEDEELVAGNEQKIEKSIADPLQKLCRYYIDCILMEQDNGKELFAESKWDLKYRDLNIWPSSKTSYPSEISDFVQKIMASNSVEGYLGYPVLLKKTNESKKLVPVFLWDVDKETGKIDSNTVPIINPRVIEHYVVKSTEAVVKELVKLEKELEIYDTTYIKSINGLTARLADIRKWQWNDTFDIRRLNTTPFSEISDVGIYNKAILFSETRSPYTKGLISELQTLSELSIVDCKGTALYDWIMGTVSEEHLNLTEEILEVLPLNTEQKLAIEKAISGELTVITGPPGTGKSQVVINLLINQIHNQGSVLFSSKNNKAVEVVIKRANEISDSPFVVKLGGKVGDSELSDVLGKILNAEARRKDRLDLNKKRDEYEKCYIELRRLKKELNSTITVRNKIDAADHELEKYRHCFDCYFKDNRRTKVSEKQSSWLNFVEKYKLVFKENNSFFDRLRWGKLQSKREAEALSCIKDISRSFEDIGQEVPKGIVQIKSLDIPSLGAKMEDYLSVLSEIETYKNLRVSLRDYRSVETIEKEYLRKADELYLDAKAYWNAWINCNRTALEAKDKKVIIEYLNGLKLLQGKDENDGVPDEVQKIFRKVQKAIPRYVDAQAVTLLSAKGRIPFEPGCFDMLVIDEASQCDIASAIPLLYRAKKAVIIGDMNQLSHVSTLPKRRDQELLRKYKIDDFSWLYSVSSLFALAQSRAGSENVVKLKEHHRSHGDIIEFSNKEFYGGDLITATKYDSFKLPMKEQPGVRWIDISGVTRRPHNGGAYNEIEAVEVVNELKRLDSVKYGGSVGVIAPFRAQAEHIRKLLEREEEVYERLVVRNSLEINTVHQFQGDERDVIIFSPTISERATDGSLYFLKENGNLFNVAITRARSILTVIGDKEFCAKSGIAYLEHFSKYVEEKMSSPDFTEYNIKPSASYPNVPNMDQVSDWEILLYKKLYAAGIKTFPQYPVDKYKLDLALFEGNRRLDIEVDGEMYHKNWDGELCYRDQLRNQRLFELGWDVKRFWVYEIRDNIDWCIREIEEWKEKYK